MNVSIQRMEAYILLCKMYQRDFPPWMSLSKGWRRTFCSAKCTHGDNPFGGRSLVGRTHALHAWSDRFDPGRLQKFSLFHCIWNRLCPSQPDVFQKVLLFFFCASLWKKLSCFSFFSASLFSFFFTKCLFLLWVLVFFPLEKRKQRKKDPQ